MRSLSAPLCAQTLQRLRDTPEALTSLVGFLVFGVAVMLLTSLGSVGPLEMGLLNNEITSFVRTDDSYGKDTGAPWRGL